MALQMGQGVRVDVSDSQGLQLRAIELTGHAIHLQQRIETKQLFRLEILVLSLEYLGLVDRKGEEQSPAFHFVCPRVLEWRLVKGRLGLVPTQEADDVQIVVAVGIAVAVNAAAARMQVFIGIKVIVVYRRHTLSDFVVDVLNDARKCEGIDLARGGRRRPIGFGADPSLRRRRGEDRWGRQRRSGRSRHLYEAVDVVKTDAKRPDK